MKFHLIKFKLTKYLIFNNEFKDIYIIVYKILNYRNMYLYKN